MKNIDVKAADFWDVYSSLSTKQLAFPGLCKATVQPGWVCSGGALQNSLTVGPFVYILFLKYKHVFRRQVTVVACWECFVNPLWSEPRHAAEAQGSRMVGSVQKSGFATHTAVLLHCLWHRHGSSHRHPRVRRTPRGMVLGCHRHGPWVPPERHCQACAHYICIKLCA